MKEEFLKYVSNYDMNNPKIHSKVEHSLRVMELMTKYAKLLDFSEEDIEIAAIIGLLHDFGRFEQVRVYNSFNDKTTVDHADYSVVQLFDNGEISKYTKNEKNYELIKFAIKNHNKLEVPECSDERVLKFTKLIRDIDKLDIMYLLGILKDFDQHVKKDLEITPEVKEFVFKNIPVDSRYAQNFNDRLIVQLAFSFDINNDIILKEYKEYLEAYYKVLEDDGRLKDVYDEVIRYINERIDNYERNRN